MFGDLLVVDGLVKEYPRKSAPAAWTKMFSRKPPLEPEMFRAVDGISFSIAAAKALVWLANPAAANPPPR